MRPCTRRIVPVEDVTKATSLDDSLAGHAPWCMSAPDALPIHIKPLLEEGGAIDRLAQHEDAVALLGRSNRLGHGDDAVHR